MLLQYGHRQLVTCGGHRLEDDGFSFCFACFLYFGEPFTVLEIQSLHNHHTLFVFDLAQTTS